ncbi:MAG: magnesium transporter [Clostridiales bacterium]|jgi:magnesium transporter|nr:magnesium transporter [Clostridiales bacterium]
MEKARVAQTHTFIQKLLDEKNYKELKAYLSGLYPVDIAEVFDELDEDECIIIFRLLNKDQAAEVFSYLNAQRQKEIVSSIHESLLHYILNDLYFDDKIDFLEEMPANFIKKLLASAPHEERRLINQFLNYQDNSAGSLMTIEYVDLKKHITAGQALERIKRTGVDKETIYTCYVLDEKRKLLGTVSLRKLVLANGHELIDDIMQTEPVKVGTADDQELVADLFKKYDLMALPVVDGEDRLIGIITIDDIMDVIEQENTEDFQKMAAMQPSDESYVETGVLTLARKRIVWLLILMVSATFTGEIITRYEALLSSAVLLMAFIPMLMDSGGNAGSQSATLIIRGIALGEIALKDWPVVLWKEFRVSLLVGAALATANFLRMLLLTGTATGVMITVSITLVLTIVAAKIVGSILPIAAKALRLDPAIMAGPLITTIVDALSLIIYFTIAGVLLF